MCRHFGYVGEPVTIKSLLLDPPHSLAEQAWRPRRQQHGTMNVDGFGIGWYAPGDPVPARYRQAGPIWSDQCVADIARVIRTGAMLCAVRSASAGTEGGAAAAAPYADGRWLFSLNGALLGWSLAAGGSVAGRRRLPIASAGLDEAADAVLRLAGSVPPAELLRLQARCDTALIWALVLARLRAGDALATALTATIGQIRAAGGTGRFNLLLTDGQVIAATAAGDSLCYRRQPGGVLVASEPSDDEPGWQEVPDESVVEATVAGVSVEPLTCAADVSYTEAGTS